MGFCQSSSWKCSEPVTLREPIDSVANDKISAFKLKLKSWKTNFHHFELDNFLILETLLMRLTNVTFDIEWKQR